MWSPGSVIDAEDDAVADLLAASIESLHDYGGWLHPAARLVEREGQLTIECDADEGDLLLRVPRSALLPVRRVNWSSDTTTLSIESIGEWPDAADLGLLLTQVGLHNACAKIPFVAATHPSAVPSLSDSVVAAMRAIVPSFRQRPMSVAEVFWATRTFAAPAFTNVPEHVAVPVLDLLDHHADGATPVFDDGFTVRVAHPTGTSQCFLDYGLARDAIEMAVVYGFADASNTQARSAPLRFTHPDTGEVLITDHGRADTGELLPIAVERDGEVWVVNRLPLADGEVVDQLTHAGGPSREWSQAMVECARALNLELLDELDAALSMQAVSPAADVLSAAVHHQRWLLSRDG